MQRLSYPDFARIAGTGLISAGLGLLAFVLITVVWGDPFTRIQAAQSQEVLEREFVAAQPGDLQSANLDPALSRNAAFAHRRSLQPGDVAGRIVIPRIGIKLFIVEGTGVEDLKKGPGLYPETNLPGTGLPVAIAGHRTTYGAPFLDIDQLRDGDEIRVEMPYGHFTYEVSRTVIIEPTNWSIIDVGFAEPRQGLRQRMKRTGSCPGSCEHLVLTACHPKYSAAQRIAVGARLVDVRLRGGAA